MDFLKAHWRPIAFGLVCLLSLGAGGWAYMAGSSIDEKLQAADRLRGAVEQARRSPVNSKSIEQRLKDVKAANEEFERSLAAALAMQKFNAFYETVGSDGKRVPAERKPLTDKVLTTQPASQSDALEFKTAYEEAYAELAKRLKGRPAPTAAEIGDYAARLDALKRQGSDSPGGNAWGPQGGKKPKDEGDEKSKQRPLPEVLRDDPRARVTEEIARKIYMYIDNGAFGKHPFTLKEDAPDEIQIWQAQMSLWIEQDMAVAISRCNEERASELAKQGKSDHLWVAYLPVKRLIRLSIDNKLGKGGGSNLMSDGFAISFTGIQNDDKMFMVPIALDLVVEEASVMRLVDKICGVGFYTPISVSYRAIKANPLQEDFIYGDQPVVQLKIDLEAYYVRKIFELWIPKPLKDVLKRPGARDELTDRGG
jgi:hypothetical protein